MDFYLGLVTLPPVEIARAYRKPLLLCFYPTVVVGITSVCASCTLSIGFDLRVCLPTRIALRFQSRHPSNSRNMSDKEGSLERVADQPRIG